MVADELQSSLLTTGDSKRCSRQALAELRVVIVLLFASKLILCLANQTIIVFAPFFAKAAGLSLAEYRLSLLATDLASIVPALLPLDHCSPRLIGTVALAGSAAAFFVPVVVPGIWALVLARFGSGVAWSAYSVVGGAVLSTVGEDRRTRAIALVETSWFVASFGVTLAGAVLDAWGANAAIVVIVVAPSLVLAIPNWWLLSAAVQGPDQQKEDARDSTSNPKESTLSVALRLGKPLTAAAMSASVMAAFQVRYGRWLHTQFKMSATDLGVFSNSIGIGNLSGNLLTQLLGDHCLPSDKVAVLMFAGSAVLAAVLALLPGSVPLPPLFVIILALFLCYECSFLTLFSFVTKAAQGSQMKGISLYFAILSCGRVAGDYLGVFPSMVMLFAAMLVGYGAAAAVLCTAQTPKGLQGS